MFTAVDSPYLVPFDGRFSAADAPTAPPDDAAGRKKLDARRQELVEELGEWQRKLYAEDRRGLLLVFQALDAAGKDGTIRAVMSGVDPSGCHVTSFKAPSEEELDHDFLWRTTRRLPPRGMIGIFNRSYYEEVLVVRVHPELLQRQRVPVPPDLDDLWDWRLQAIREHELHLARQGMVVVKFWLKVSREEQRKRLLKRIDDPARNWKFEPRDVVERGHWKAYHHAYEAAVGQTSRPWAPWYCIPADDKAFMRQQVAEIVVQTLRRMDPRYPEVDQARRTELQAIRDQIDERGE